MRTIASLTKNLTMAAEEAVEVLRKLQYNVTDVNSEIDKDTVDLLLDIDEDLLRSRYRLFFVGNLQAATDDFAVFVVAHIPERRGCHLVDRESAEPRYPLQRASQRHRAMAHRRFRRRR